MSDTNNNNKEEQEVFYTTVGRTNGRRTTIDTAREEVRFRRSLVMQGEAEPFPYIPGIFSVDDGTQGESLEPLDDNDLLL